MTVRKEQRRAGARWVIDILYTKPDGTPARYRKDAQIQTKAGALAEERQIVARIARYGEPVEPARGNAVDAAEKPAAASSTPSAATPSKRFGDVVAEYRTTFMLTDLKVTTRRGYFSVLEHTLLPRFAHLPISVVDNAAAAGLDLELSKRKRMQSTRNNVQIVLRSVLRFAVSRGYLAERPKGLPRLNRIGQSILEIPSDDDVATILAAATDSQRRAFALMAFTGLRPNEVRALRRRDVRLRRENGEAVGGFLSIREGSSFGVSHTPKTGQREVPIPPPLARLLAPIEKAAREALVAKTAYGKAWGQFGIDQAFERVRDRVGLEGWSVYCLRHYAITSWLRAGVPVHVVQRMAGHKHLSTTQRYVHHLKEDLEEAARRMAEFGERRAEQGGNGSGNGGRDGDGNVVETEGVGQAGKRGRRG